MPPTYIFGAGLDPLVDEGDAYSEVLVNKSINRLKNFVDINS